MSDFREQFGIDYLKKKTTQPTDQTKESQNALPGMDEALLVYGRRALDILKSEPSGSGRVFDLAKKLNIRVDVAMPVCSYLLSKGYLDRIEEDSLGNDMLQLTPEGDKLLG